MKRILLLCISVGFLFSTQAQNNADTLSERSVTLNELVVSVNKVEEIKRNVAQQVLVLPMPALQQAHALTTAELLSYSGIPVQKSQLGGGSPILRGFEASRIGLVIDGVRMNNLIYRAGHLQDIIKTDNTIFNRVEILYGPSSTIYGSDALGGVIHMYTQKPLLAEGGAKQLVKVNVLMRYESACKGSTAHFDLNYGAKKFASLTSFTFNTYGDLMGGKSQNPFYDSTYGERPQYVQYMGIENGKVKDSLMKNNDPYLQVGSGEYKQYDLVQKFLYQQTPRLSHGLNIQYSNSTNVPRYDRLTDPNGKGGLASAEWYYGPQMRLLTAYDLNLKNENSYFRQVHLGLSYQALQESRHNRNFGNRFLTHRTEDVRVVGANLDLLRTTGRHTIRLGLDAQLNFLRSTAERHDIVLDTGSTGNWDSRYPDGKNRMHTIAAYYSHTWAISDAWVLTDGVRVGYTVMHSTLVDTAIMFSLPYTTIDQQTPVYSGSVGLIHSPSDKLKLSLLVSTGYRVPNVDDLSKIFGSVPGMVIVPNPELKPERTVNYELGITKLFSKKVIWENAFYYTTFSNIAVIAPSTFNGQDSLLYDGTLSKVYSNQNRDHAFIYGVSSNLAMQLNKQFNITAGVNYTYGRLKTDAGNTPLDHIPPFTARTAFNYTKGRFGSDLILLYNSWKRLADYGGGEDNLQYATPDGMPAWYTINLRMSYKVQKHITLQAGIDNIGDMQYRTFASGINAPGRNFIVALRGQF